MDKMIELLFSTGNAAAAAVIITTIYFLREIRLQRREYFEESQQRLTALKEISSKHDDNFKTCAEKLDGALSRNTEAFARCEAALGRGREGQKA